MEERILMAGFGGQGIMMMGKLLTYASMREGKEVTWLPSYGPQVRGGTANCSVVISESRIASPYVDEPASLIVMARPSLEKFEPFVKPGGLIILNSSMVKSKLRRKDLIVYKIPANEAAEKLGSIRTSNMVALGAFIRVKPIVPIDALLDSLDPVLSTRHKELLDINRIALKHGFEMVVEGSENE